MKFSETELLPGVVTEINDPKMLGRVKATVPTLFDENVMSKDGLPWIYPLTMHGYQGFSKLQKGSKIWVFKQNGKPREFWYIPMFELNKNTRDIVESYKEPDILISRSAGTESVYIYYTDTDGIQLKIGSENYINIKPDSSITLKSGQAQIDLKEGKVFIGDGNASEPAILGNKLFDALTHLSQNLGALGAACTNPFTLPLATVFQQASTTLNQDIQNIRCENTINN